MPKLFFTGTPEKGDMNVHQPPPPTVVTASARPPLQTPKESSKALQQQQQQQRKGVSSDPKKKLLFDCVEPAPSIQNDSTATAPSSGGDKSVMMESLLNRSKDLLANTDQSKRAAASSVETWNEVGIFVNNNDGDGGKTNGQGDTVDEEMENGGEVEQQDNNGDGGKRNGRGDSVDKEVENGGEAERVLFQWANNSIPVQQQQVEQEEQVVQEKTNDVNTTETEVIVIDDSSDEEKMTELQQLYKGKEWDNKSRDWVSIAAETGKEPVQSAAPAWEREVPTEMTKTKERDNVTAAVAAPIIHVSASNRAEETEENKYERNVPVRNHPADNTAKNLPGGVRPLGHEGLDDTKGMRVPVAAKETAKESKEPTAQAQEQEVPQVANKTSASSSGPIIIRAAAANNPQRQQTFVDKADTWYTHTSPEEFQEMYQKQQQQLQLQQLNKLSPFAPPNTAQDWVLKQADPTVQNVHLYLQQQQLLQLQLQQQQMAQQQQRQQLLQHHVHVAPRNATNEQNRHEKGGALNNSRTNPPAPLLQQQQQQRQPNRLTQQQQRQPQVHQVAPRTATNERSQHRSVGAQSNKRNTSPVPPMPTNTATANGNDSDKALRSNSLPDLERFSEYQIDSARSITELEAIRHRLLVLVERTNSRLKEMRVQRALGNEIGVKDAEKLSTKELIDILSQQAEMTSGSMHEDTAVATTGKRDHGETEEQPSRPRKRQKCCPLCLSTSHLTPETNFSGATRGAATRTRSITCSVCEEDGICFKCHSRCLKCLKTICADCFATCSKCNSSAYCSDCVDTGNGKCASCFKLEQRSKMRAAKRATNRTKNTESLLSVFHPGDTQIPTQITVRATDLRTERNEILPSVANQSNRDGTPIPTQTTERAADPKSSESHAQHRFYISGDIEKIGCCIRGPEDGKVTLVEIEENSLAARLGIQEGDELFVPDMSGDMIRKNFIAAVKDPHPMIFHVLRSCSKPRDDSTLHRFTVHDPGMLGVRIKKMNDTTFISCVDPGSLAERHGICKGDVMCKPFTNGSVISDMYDWFYIKATSADRPFTFEVFRKKSVTPTPCHYSFGDENPFLCRIPAGSSGEEANNGKANDVATTPPLED